MNQDQLRAKALALFHSLVSSWANDLRKDVTTLQEEFNRRLDALQERMAKYEENFDENRILAFGSEVARVAGGGTGAGDELSRVRQSMVRLEGGGSLPEVLSLLVRESAQFAPRVALFILKGGACIGWKGRGFDQTPGLKDNMLKRISVPSKLDTVFRSVVTSRSRFLGESTAHKDNAQLLTRMGNVLPTSIFAMPLVLRDRVAAVLYADSGESPAPLQRIEAVEILGSYACRLLDVMGAGKTSAAVRSTPEISPERVEKIRASAPAAVTPTPPPAAPAVAPREEGEESGTVMFKAEDVQAEVSAGVSTPAAPPPAPAEQVEVETRKQHEEARRFARLLVSEIKLYNEAKVQEGRANRNLYHQLKDDIERSRQLYFERVPEAVRAATNYFNEEIVRILADGDEGVMGHRL